MALDTIAVIPVSLHLANSSPVLDVIYKYLDCGDLHQGFDRIKCNDCHHEYLLPFSCKRRHFCPSCHQKRVIEFGEQLHEEVLEKVPHRTESIHLQFHYIT